MGEPERPTTAMRCSYIHLSDLHFGQERGPDLHLHQDVRERLIDDAAELAAAEPARAATGVIVTGDIAFSGKETQYQEAGKWLDRLCEAVGCSSDDVFVVPGNHDIDRDGITPGCEVLLERVQTTGEEELERYLQNLPDRELLYRRLKNYRAFAEAYDCPIDTQSGYAVDRTVQIAAERRLRLIGLNSALICSRTNEEEGRLLLGARQRTLPRNCGEELVVLCHHPLDWLRDSADTERFVRARARVFMSGHTHRPSSIVERNEAGGDIMFIAAGAAVPPSDEVGYEFTYNKLVFGWDADIDALTLQIEARTWSAEATGFAADPGGIGRMTQTLRCPNCERAGDGRLPEERDDGRGVSEPIPVSRERETGPERRVTASADHLLRLRFFRDLTVKQRATVLTALGAIPDDDWIVAELTHTLARGLLDGILTANRGAELRRAIDAAVSGD